MLRFHWFLPTTGDGHDVRSAITTTDAFRPAGRPASLAYLTQVGRAAEQAGFGGQRDLERNPALTGFPLVSAVPSRSRPQT
ncbi:hypothetical protein [Nonomuraea wenchangensis]|uniref:Alkanesulfonate monooxygenase n=1 Tax=Nonomuraea wenchangensis TaxID=568860 RepID=A0A1I0KI66_9ACTN|nr:hypothetical protein [Nonomuraea wenchangensis]SEU24313.1 hypothetical protein SAMN05421811_10871 [Nonomuraea wenchangensis]